MPRTRRRAPGEFGDDHWQAETAKELGLESTMRARGRPKPEEEGYLDGLQKV